MTPHALYRYIGVIHRSKILDIAPVYIIYDDMTPQRHSVVFYSYKYVLEILATVSIT